MNSTAQHRAGVSPILETPQNRPLPARSRRFMIAVSICPAIGLPAWIGPVLFEIPGISAYCSVPGYSEQ